MVVAILLSLQDFAIPDPQMPWELNSLLDNLALVLSMAVVAMAIPLLFARFLVPLLPVRSGMIPSVTLAGAHSTSESSALAKVGTRGTTRTALRPAGKANFEGQTLEVMTRGEFIEPGVAIVVVKLEGNGIFVKAESGATV